MTAKKRRATVGRPEFEPTEQQRRQVTLLAGRGVEQEDIAQFLEISEPTLRKHFYLELRKGISVGRVRNAERLHRAAEEGSVAAMIWLDKTRYKIVEPAPMQRKEALANEAQNAHAETKWANLLQ